VICSRPFKRFEVSYVNGVGSSFMCCTGWLNRQIGDLRTQSVEDIWNGKPAQDVRRSILDGSFEFCSRSKCPYLESVSGPVARLCDVKDAELKDAIARSLTVLPYGPRELSFSYDRSCNLSCPSCRNHVIVDIAGKDTILRVQEALKSQALKDAHYISITGSGDPFGSPYLRKLLQTMKCEEMPNLKTIHLHTNAQLWTPSMWETIPAEIRRFIKSTHISIDAACSETYLLNRRGGSFEKLIQNLEFIGALRQTGPLGWMCFSMVVQANNFREMPEFVLLGKEYGVDEILFTQITNWGTFSGKEFKSRDVHDPDHPQYAEFTDLIRTDIFKDPVVRSHFPEVQGRRVRLANPSTWFRILR
jgi:hypothetical protein